MKGSILFLVASLLIPCSAIAWPRGTTPEEISVLPRWCGYTQGSKVPGAYERYVAEYGNGWSHMHHYCYALVSINRINRMAVSKAAMPGTIRGAKADLTYVLERTAAPFPWRPEMFVALARLQLREGKADEAARTAQVLIAESPEVADGYTMLAEVLLRSGRKQEADKVLAKGEQMVSDQERFRRLRSILPGQRTN